MDQNEFVKKDQHPKPSLTKEARQVLAKECQQHNAQYNNTLSIAYEAFDQSINVIAMTHKKSVNKVRGDLSLKAGHIVQHCNANAWNAFTKKKAEER